MSKPVYDCPVPGCTTTFTADEKQGDRCPCGRVGVKGVRENKPSGGFGYKYILAEPNSEEVRAAIRDFKGSSPEDEGNVVRKNEYPKLVASASESGISAEIWLDRPRVQEEVEVEDGEIKVSVKQVAKYRIWFQGIIFKGVVPCPSCYQPLCDNSYIQIIQGAQEHKCRHKGCKAEVDIIYGDPMSGRV